eukprot:GHVS01053463.1.p1 GENE.GHVS01053463.1~~GHVS01053463.1.p1  ORF type:complete len:248 (+),score=43.84 GHVS01053463.1:28-744(+)
MTGIYPASSVVDVGVVVGYTKDGGQIILGKTLFRNIATFPNDGDITAAWWFVVNYDSSSYPATLQPGQSIGPIAEAVTYHHQGLFDRYGVLSYFLGLEGFATNPYIALQRLIYFMFIRPIAGLPPTPGSDVAQLLQQWPTAGNPLPEYVVEAAVGPPGWLPKSGRVPGYPSSLGDPLVALGEMATLVEKFLQPLQNPLQLKLNQSVVRRLQQHYSPRLSRPPPPSFSPPSPPSPPPPP